jgi:hypothetical protein
VNCEAFRFAEILNACQALPFQVRRLADANYALLKRDPYHPSLPPRMTRITDLPDVSSPGDKNIYLPFFRNQWLYPRVPLPLEGRLANRHKRWNGMRWTCRNRQACDPSADEQSRVVPIPRRWDQVLGDDPKAMVAKEPGTPGRARNKP